MGKMTDVLGTALTSRLTPKRRAKLRETIAKATPLAGATVGSDAESFYVEQAGYFVASSPLDGEPMSDDDLRYNTQVGHNAQLFAEARVTITDLLDELEDLERRCLMLTSNADSTAKEQTDAA